MNSDYEESPALPRRLKVEKISTGHNFAEIYIQFGEEVFTLSPGAAKRLTIELGSAIQDWESEHGSITPPRPADQLSLPKRVLKALYRESHPSSKLTRINTGKRKKR